MVADVDEVFEIGHEKCGVSENLLAFGVVDGAPGAVADK
jgi:hypothetical protein